MDKENTHLENELKKEDSQEKIEEAPQEPSLEEQLAAMKDNWLRALAEAENVRRRVQREKEDALKYATTSFARDIVNIADNMRRAFSFLEKEDVQSFPPSIQGLVQGVEMILKELDTAFEKHSIKRIHPHGEKFDPHYHQAMFEIESLDHPAGTVLQVMQDGYVLHDRLLRPAFVGVSKKAPEEITEAQDTIDETI